MDNIKTLAIIDQALANLYEIREGLLDLVLAGKLTPADFVHINALEQQLQELKDANTPPYRPITWADICKGS